MNPYKIPNLEGHPRATLRPFEWKDHEKYYVKVDNTFVAYQEFQERIGAVNGLLDEGRLVVALGLDGCGKTSLLNRCAVWIRDELAKQNLKGLILPLTDDVPEVQSLEARSRHVFQCVVDDLRRHDLLDNNGAESLEKRSDDLDRGYRALSDVLKEDQVLIVILPSSELVEEVTSYARRTRKKIVFLAESSHVDQFDQQWAAIASVGRTSPIRLDVGLLEAEHGWLFTLDRQERQPEDSPYPKVSKQTIQKVMEGAKLSIGRLQEILYVVYHEFSQRPPELNDVPLPEITYQDITETYFRLILNNQTRIYPR